MFLQTKKRHWRTHTLHDKKRSIIKRNFENFHTYRKLDKRSKNVPNANRMEGVPNQANVKPRLRKLWDNVPNITFFEGTPKDSLFENI